MRFGRLSLKLDLNSQLHKSLVEFAREQLQQSHFLFFGNAEKIYCELFLYSSVTYFFFADYCQCQSITVLASVSLFTVASIYTIQCIHCSGVASLSLCSQTDINLDAGASKVGLYKWDCCPTAVLYSQWPNIFMLLNERRKKAKFFFFFYYYFTAVTF